ncbi:UNVERIFIED_CONTAM: Benzyl alcohol O-benzoyltransferase [Sesamum calycinum]|uniref:Benzyl alcohol O-benzoyltransferase n=1 Tax=Sesamum calycinum TaxID=2727403 RepID=A0AAW2J318_9LAMI
MAEGEIGVPTTQGLSSSTGLELGCVETRWLWVNGRTEGVLGSTCLSIVGCGSRSMGSPLGGGGWGGYGGAVAGEACLRQWLAQGAQWVRPAHDRHGPTQKSSAQDQPVIGLVYYYSFIGQPRECMGEGALFIEADADVRMQQFNDTLQSLFPCLEEFLLDVPGSGGVVNRPLLLLQHSGSDRIWVRSMTQPDPWVSKRKHSWVRSRVQVEGDRVTKMPRARVAHHYDRQRRSLRSGLPSLPKGKGCGDTPSTAADHAIAHAEVVRRAGAY